MILSTPPATPVAPKSSRPNAFGKLSYLPPPTSAPMSDEVSKASFITAPDYMQNTQTFNEIAAWCDFPPTVSILWIRLVEAWMEGSIHDKIFLDYVAMIDPNLFRATYCLIDVYSGGSI